MYVLLRISNKELINCVNENEIYSSTNNILFILKFILLISNAHIYLLDFASFMC